MLNVSLKEEGPNDNLRTQTPRRLFVNNGHGYGDGMVDLGIDGGYERELS